MVGAVQVVDATGRAVWQADRVQSGTSVEVSGLAPGWYRAEVATASGTASVQLLVQ